MDAKNIYLDKNAIDGLILANIAGPNCLSDPGKLSKIYDLNQNQKKSVNEIAQNFDEQFGPIATIINYVVSNLATKIENTAVVLNLYDIIKIYCGLGHKNIVRAADMNFIQGTASYFMQLHNAGFTIKRRNLLRFLLSCIGKVGIIEKINGGDYIVGVWIKGKKIRFHNIFSPIKLHRGQKVAIHYAMVFAVIDDKLFESINQSQQKDAFWDQFSKIKRIYYKKWLNNDLNLFSQNQYQKLL